MPSRIRPSLYWRICRAEKTRHPQARRISPINIATCLKIDKAYCKIFINDEVFWINIHQGNARAMNCIKRPSICRAITKALSE